MEEEEPRSKPKPRIRKRLIISSSMVVLVVIGGGVVGFHYFGQDFMRSRSNIKPPSSSCGTVDITNAAHAAVDSQTGDANFLPSADYDKLSRCLYMGYVTHTPVSLTTVFSGVDTVSFVQYKYDGAHLTETDSGYGALGYGIAPPVGCGSFDQTSTGYTLVCNGQTVKFAEASNQ